MELITSRALETIPLSPVDVSTASAYPTIMFLFRGGLDVARLKETLPTLLQTVPDVAGRLIRHGGHYYIAQNDAGVAFDVVDIDSPMPDYGVANPVVDTPPVTALPNPTKIVNSDLPLCRIQITRFKCGAAILSMYISHVLCDGFGRGWFLAHWARLCRNAPALPPMDVNRNTLIQLAEDHAARSKCSKEYVEMSLEELTKRFEGGLNEPCVLKAFRVSACDLTALRDSVVQGLEGIRVSRQDVLAAKLWQTLSLTRTGNDSTRIFLVQDFRRNRNFGLGEHYFGNAVTHTAIDYETRDVSQQSLGILAQRIRTSSASALDLQRISADLAFQRRHGKIDSGTLAIPKEWIDFPSNAIGFNNFSRFPIGELDFGTGTPFWVFGNLWKSPGRSLIIFPMAHPVDPGFAIYINLPESQMQNLLTIMADDIFFQSY